MPEVLEPFPEIMALGHSSLRKLLDQWLDEPLAEEFSLETIELSPDCRMLSPVYRIFPGLYDKGDSLPFPMDKVLEYVIVTTFEDPLRTLLLSRLRDMRRRAGPEVFQRYKVNVQAYTMALRCPSCLKVMLTQYRIFAGQAFRLASAEPVDCPRCSSEFEVQENDFFPVIDPAYGDAVP